MRFVLKTCNSLSLSGMIYLLIGFLFLNVNASAQIESAQVKNVDQTFSTSPYTDRVNIRNPVKARQNWVLNCQGCHGVKAVPLVPEMPNLNGHVSKFLSVEGGREFLGYVPGIATAPLNDDELADLVNWMFVTFDPGNIPDGFEEYTSNEIRGLRATPLSSNITEVRNQLIAKVKAREKIKDVQQDKDKK